MDHLFKHDYFLHPHTTFHIGGPASHFIEVHTVEMMQQLIAYCYQQRLRYFILGKGSNTLFDDRGFDGLVILNKITFMETLSPTTFRVGAGYSFSLLGAQTARKGLGGLEFASGIPGSVGGAVYMNAGANGHETASVLTHVDYVTASGELMRYSKAELTFSYRHSPFQNMQGAIVAATFELTNDPEAKKRQIDIIHYRKKTQPYKDHSAGCVFANPSGCLGAGALIDQQRLKGQAVGDAAVSTVHANFIINKGNARSQDILTLIDLIRNRIKENCAVDLECEIRYIPYRE